MVRTWLTKDIIFPFIVGLRGYKYSKMYRELIAFENLPLLEQRKVQWENFINILEHCRQHVPYYKRKFHDFPEEIKDFSDLVKVPILTKKDIEANFPDQITAENISKDDWEYHATGGTTSRLICITDKQTRHIQMARNLCVHHFSGKCYLGRKRLSVPPDICSIVCGARKSEREIVLDKIKKILKEENKLYNLMVSLRWSIWPIFHKFTFREKELPSFGPEGTSLGVKELDFYIEQIGRCKPYMLTALPTYLHMLAYHIKENGLTPPSVRVIKPMGASASPKVKQFIGQTFKCDAFEHYGSHEFDGIASECNAHQGLHICMSDFIVEIVKDGRHAAEGELGHILITDLKNKVMPFIRYKIGDVGRFYKSKCSCGRESVRITVEGRLQDLIVAPNGKAFTGDFFQDFFLDYPYVKFFQLNQKAKERFELLLVPANKQVEQQKMITDLKKHLGPVQIDCYEVKSIIPEVSGKFRHVKSTTYEDFK